jgi:hypothetical protein
MADDVLRMQASVVDKATGPLRLIQREIQAIGKTGGLSQLRSEFVGLERAIAPVGRELRSVMAIGGLAGGGFVAGILGATAALKGMASASLDLKNLSDQTGLTTGQIRNFATAAQRLQIAPEAAQAALGKLSRSLFEIKRNLQGGAQEELFKRGAGDLVAQLRVARTSAEALDAIVRRGDTIKRTQGIEAAREYYQTILGNADLARLSAEKLRKEMERQWSPENVARIQQFNDRIVDLGSSFEDLKITVVNELAGPLGGVMKDVTKYIEANQGEIGKNIATGIRDLGSAAKGTAGFLKEIVDWIKWIDEKAGEAGKKYNPFYLKKDDLQDFGGENAGVDVREPKKEEWRRRQQRSMDLPKPPALPDRDRWPQFYDAIRKGAKEGIEDGLKLQNYNGRGIGDGAPSIVPAAYHPGGGGSGLAGKIFGFRGGAAGPSSGEGGTGATGVPGLMQKFAGVAGGGGASAPSATGVPDMMQKFAGIPGGGVAGKGPVKGGAPNPFAKGGIFTHEGADAADQRWHERRGAGAVPPMGANPGASRADRNNNPGNLKFGDFAKSHGATGPDDKGFAQFPDAETGRRAASNLLGRSDYAGKTLGEIGKRWAEGDPNWAKNVSRATGIGVDERPNLTDPAVRDKLVGGIGKAEGYGSGLRDQLRGAGEAGPGTNNFMRGQFGGPGQNLVTVQTEGGRKLTVNAESATAIKGFVSDLEGAGAPIKSVGSYSHRNIAGSGRWSQHAYGNAVDINQRARDIVSPEFRAWAEKNQDALRGAERKWGMKSGGDWRNPDFGHWEWGGTKPWLKDEKDRPDPGMAESPDPFGVKRFQAARGEQGSGAPGWQRGLGYYQDGRTSPLGGDGEQGLDTARLDGALRRQTDPTFNATGKLTVDVNAPRGTKVAAEGGGLFRDVETRRSMQMPMSADGPAESFEGVGGSPY